MKKFIVLLACILLTSCGGDTVEGVEYEILSGELSYNGTYKYCFDDSSLWEIKDDITTTKIFNVGDKFTISINKVEIKEITPKD